MNIASKVFNTMPNILYIDTSGAAATVALSQNGQEAARRVHENANEQAAVLNIMIDEVLATAGISLSGISAISVCAGPGSYTGLRVGLSAAKGIAYATDIPLMLFNRLGLLAIESGANAGGTGIALKARTGEYFFAAYDSSGKEAIAPQHIFEKELGQLLAETPGLYVVTDDEAFALTGNAALIRPNHPADIMSWIPAAEQRWQQQQFDDLAYCEPFYLKAAYTTQSKK
jgi:tRNA threonylcarbamoyladenosine biosynthesis protein TsaB